VPTCQRHCSLFLFDSNPVQQSCSAILLSNPFVQSCSTILFVLFIQIHGTYGLIKLFSRGSFMLNHRCNLIRCEAFPCAATTTATCVCNLPPFPWPTPWPRKWCVCWRSIWCNCWTRSPVGSEATT
jgi:hypothetical protein